MRTRLQRPRVEWSKQSLPVAAGQIAVITLITLKLTGVITWSWWWVLSPMWGGGILVVLGLCSLLVQLHWQTRRRMRRLMDVPPDGWQEFQEWLMARKANPDASSGDLGLQDGEGQAASPPGG